MSSAFVAFGSERHRSLLRIAAAVSGFTAGSLGYTGHFVLSTILSLTGLIAVVRLTLKLNGKGDEGLNTALRGHSE